MKFDKFILGLFLLIATSTAWAQPVEEEQPQDGPDISGPESVTEAFDQAVSEKFGATEAKVDASKPKEQIPVNEEGEELIYLNATDVEIQDMIKQISKATGTNFLLDDRIRGKVTIISEKPMTKDMAYQAFLSALQVMGYTTVNTPAGLVKIVSTKDAINSPLDIYKDKNPYTDQFITRIYQAKNISANELSQVIKTLVSKEGNLFAYPQTNSFIITDSGSNIDRILRIAKELDTEGPQEVIEIIPIQNADAKDITEKVLQLFEEDAQTGGGRAPRARSRGTELEEAPSISKVIADDRTNSIIVLGSKRAILKIRALIAKLDSEIKGVEGTIHVYYLKHANSKEMSDVLGGFVQDVGATTEDKGAKKGKPAKSGAVQLEGGVKVTADEGTNSLVITASPKDFQTLVDKVIVKLDIPRRQVYLEAVVMELSVEKNRTLGLSGNFGNVFNIGGNRVTAFGALPPLAPNAISSIATAAGGLAGGGFSERTIDFGTGDGAVSIPAISTILQAFQTDNDVNILSTPSILTLDNEEAKIQVGQEVPIPSGQAVSSGVTTTSVSREDVGIILTITPQISEADSVRLKISQEISDVGAVDPVLGPTLTKKSVETVVVARDKQTIVIGGLIDDKQTVSSSKVPLLGDIPILGNLFKNSNTRKSKTNLLVFITPYIIRERADFLGILEKKIEERNLFIDLNYGYGQRRQIRKAITLHAKDLLEYSTLVQNNPNYAPIVNQAPTTQATTPSVVDQATPASGTEKPAPEEKTKEKTGKKN